MTRRRWIADEVKGNIAALVGEHAAHLSRVLRAQVGQEFDIATGGAVRRGTIISIAGDRVEFALGEEITGKPSAHLTLVLSIFKFDRMEWAIEKCTEIGVSTIIPLIARRTDSHLAAAAGRRRERWQRLARQASEQARRGGPPEIATPVRFKELATAVSGSGAPQASPELAGKSCGVGVSDARIVLAESESDTYLRNVLPPGASGAVLAIGPEGGWTDEELRWFCEAGWAAASLGDTILRAETAAVVATALALDVLR